MAGDIRHGIRVLKRRPGFTAAAIAAIALGIAANTLVFSVVDTVLLRSFPYPNTDELVFLWKARADGRYMVSYADALSWRSRKTLFADVAVYAPASFDLWGTVYSERFSGRITSASLFATLGVKARLGRTFLPEDERMGRDGVVLISSRLWRSRFGGNPQVVGSEILLSLSMRAAEKYTVIGVLPDSMQAAFPTHSDLWAPIAVGGEDASSGGGWMNALARLRPGVPLEQARLAMQGVDESGFGVALIPFHEGLVGDTRLMLLSIGGAVLFVLLIAAANVANLMLAQAAEREREFAIRAALGAGRCRLFRQIITESLLVSVLGGAAGLLVSLWCVGLVKTLLPAELLRGDQVTIDARVVLFAFVVTAFTGLVFGLAPALCSSCSDARLAPHSSRGRSPGKALRHTLVTAEVALGLVLLSGAGLMIGSFVRLLGVNPGFNPRDLLSLETYLPPDRYRTDADRLRFMELLLDGVRSLPEVRYAGVTDFRPMGSSMHITVSAPGAAALPARREIVGGDYFQAMGTPLVRGRFFSGRDTPGSAAVAIINETAARRYWSGEEAIGKQIVLQQGKETRHAEIVGVVGDVRRRLNLEPDPAIYLPQTQMPTNRMELTIRAEAGQPAAVMAPAIRSVMAALDRELGAEQVAAMDEVVFRARARPRFLAALLGSFGFLALALAATGVYGLTSYTVRLRMREIGVRVAVGASRRDILQLLLAQGALLTFAGIAIGYAVSLATNRVLASQLYGVKPTDPLVLATVVMFLATVGMAASFLPALRGAQVDPVTVLRHE